MEIRARILAHATVVLQNAPVQAFLFGVKAHLLRDLLEVPVVRAADHVSTARGGVAVDEGRGCARLRWHVSINGMGLQGVWWTDEWRCERGSEGCEDDDEWSQHCEGRILGTCGEEMRV